MGLGHVTVLNNMITRLAKTKQALHGQVMDCGWVCLVWAMHSPRRWIGWGFPSISPWYQPGSFLALSGASVRELDLWIQASSPPIPKSHSPVCTTGKDEQLLDSLTQCEVL